MKETIFIAIPVMQEAGRPIFHKAFHHGTTGVSSFYCFIMQGQGHMIIGGVNWSQLDLVGIAMQEELKVVTIPVW